MPRYWLALLFVGAFTLATILAPGLRQWSNRKSSRSVLASLMGDSRRLFANHFFIQADVYLHSGYYPSIFDSADFHNAAAEAAVGLESHDSHEHEEHHDEEHDDHEEHNFLGQPRNWIDAFGRHFFPSKHTHLGEDGEGIGAVREILPWIKLSAELDPEHVESYTVAAYWLRQMNKNIEALQFLREGLRANPGSYEILFELGRCYEERSDSERARNLWELALRRWQDQEASQEEPNHLMLAQILTHLIRLEAHANRRDQAVVYLEMLKHISPNPQAVQKRIEEVQAGLPFEATIAP